MGRLIKRLAMGLFGIVLLAAIAVGVYAYTQTSSFDSSMNKTYDVAPLTLARSSDEQVIARGKHLAASLAGCSLNACHGSDLGGGEVTDMGPIGTLAPPNITNILPAYSDGELARLIRHGIKKDHRGALFMPIEDFNWLPDADVVALVSYMRTVPAVDRPNKSTTHIKTLGKILDRKGLLPLDVASRVQHDHIVTGPPPSPTAEYGAFIARLCMGCHGEHLGGGPIPGAPPKMAIPLNLTPDATGLKGWTYEEFEHLIQTGTRKTGKALDPMMPVEALRAMDDVERHALWAHLQAIPAVPFGSR